MKIPKIVACGLAVFSLLWATRVSGVDVGGMTFTNGTVTWPDHTKQISAGLTNLPMGATLLVDSVYGNDSTAVRGNLSKPFATLTNAAYQARAGDTIRLNPGTFTLDGTIFLSNYVSIVGAGVNNTTIMLAAPEIRMGVGSTVSDFTAFKTLGSGANGGLIAGGTNIVIRNCFLSSVYDVLWEISGTNYIWNTTLQATDIGIGSSDVLNDQNTSTGTIHIFNNCDISIDAGLFGGGFYVYRTVIANNCRIHHVGQNLFSGGFGFVKYGVIGSTEKRVFLNHCTYDTGGMPLFADNSMGYGGGGSNFVGGLVMTNYSASATGPIMGWMDIPSGPVGATLRVDAVNGNDATAIRGQWERPYATISNALLAAVSNDVVYIGAGTNLVNTPPLMPKSISIIGQSRGGSIIKLRHEGNLSGDTGFYATNVYFANLTIITTNAGNSQAFYNSKDITVFNCELRGNTDTILNPAGTNTFTNCRITTTGDSTSADAIADYGSPTGSTINRFYHCEFDIDSTGMGFNINTDCELYFCKVLARTTTEPVVQFKYFNSSRYFLADHCYFDTYGSVLFATNNGTATRIEVGSLVTTQAVGLVTKWIDSSSTLASLNAAMGSGGVISNAVSTNTTLKGTTQITGTLTNNGNAIFTNGTVNIKSNLTVEGIINGQGTIVLTTNSIVFGVDVITNVLISTITVTNLVTSGQNLTVATAKAGYWTWVGGWSWYPNPGGGGPSYIGFSTNGASYYFNSATGALKWLADDNILPYGSDLVISNLWTGTQPSNNWFQVIYIPTGAVSWVQSLFYTNFVDAATNLLWTAPYDCLAVQSGSSGPLVNSGTTTFGRGGVEIGHANAISVTLVAHQVKSADALTPPSSNWQFNPLSLSTLLGGQMGLPLYTPTARKPRRL